MVAATLRDSNGRLVAACLFARGKNPFVRKWTSLPCSDSSPPLARDEGAREQLLAAIAQSRLAAEGLVEIRGWSAPEPWRKATCFADWMLDLDRPLSLIERGLGSNFRRQLHRGREGSFAIKVDRGLPGLMRFYRLALETRRRLGVPAQPWRFFQAVYDAFAPNDNLEVWSVSQRGMAIAATVLLRDGEDIHYKWSARIQPTPMGANHRLVAAVLAEYAQQCRFMHLGRTDTRNTGLSRFKKEMGAKPHPLPYSYLPQVPAHVSPEVLADSQLRLSMVWRRLPLSVTRLLGSMLYQYIV
ncbi:GNAT family N-acetyltransferase [Candidatus Binatus sp.]|uniref:GNAT family N-acetyltransferase n=1 Tax=Candidatus Binatus sp. TaxID=2811406 RepID=UPI00272C0C39|nr:GNAT family N-acetyltransferase [Candidatus Binatus sp.]